MPTKQLVLLVLFRISRSVAAGMITLAFPYLILGRLHYSSLVLGFLYTAAALATAVLGLATGFLADLWGRRKTLFLLAITLPVSTALVYLGRGLPVLFIGAALGGFSATGSLMGGGVGGAAQPIQSAIVASLTGPHVRTTYFSIFTFLSGIFAAAGALMAKLVTVRGAFLVATAIAAVGVLVLLWLEVPEPKPATRKIRSARTIGKFSLTGALNGFSQGLITPFLIPYFVLVFHVTKDRMATYSFVAGTLGSFALLAAPQLERWFGFVRSIALTRGLNAALVAAMPFLPHLVGALVIYITIPALRVMAVPIQQRALTQMVDDSETGRALGVNQVTRIGASSGAVSLTGFLFSEADYMAPFVIYGALLAGNILLYFRFFWKEERAAAAAEPDAES